MNENPEINSAVPETAKLPYLQFASILLSGLEKLAEIQKSALSVFSDAIKNSTDSIKPVFAVSPAPLFEMAEQAIREFLRIQVRLLDLMLSQTSEKRKEIQAHSDPDFESEVARLMLDSTDCLLNMQKKAVEFIAGQNHTFSESMREQAGNGDGHLSNPEELIQPDASAIIEAQKKFWDATQKPFRAWQAETSRNINA